MVLSQHFFPFRTTLFYFIIDIFQCYFHVSNLIQKFQIYWVESSTKSILVINKYCYIDYPVSYHHSCTSVLYQLSSLTMIYSILGFKSFSPTFLVAMSANCRPPSHQKILCILNFSPLLTTYNHLQMCLLCLVSLLLLSIQTSDLIFNIIRGYYSGTIYGYFFNNSWINIMKCAESTNAVHSALYSISALDWATGPGTCVTGSIVPRW